MKRSVISKILFVACLVLLAGQFFFQIHLAKVDAQTTDEAVHLSAGYTYLKYHDFRFNPEHPVLVKMFAAIPLYFLKVKIPQNFNDLWNQSSNFYFDNWRQNRALGEELLYQSGANAEHLLFLGRLPTVLLTLLLGIAIFLAAKRYYSNLGAFIATSLFVFNPIVNAHGHLITTDIAVSLGYFLTIIALLNFFKKKDNVSFALLVLPFAFAELVKFTAIILYPATILLFVYASWVGIIRKGDRLKIFVKLILLLVLVWGIIWGAYQFKTDRIPQVDSIYQAMTQTNYSDNGSSNSKKLSQISENQKSGFDKVMKAIAPILVPRDYFKGLFMIITHVEGGHNSYLLGHTSREGWWYYFPVVLAAKNPIPTLILIALGIFAAIYKNKMNKENTFLLIAALVFLMFAMFSKANLGVRHVLPVLPILFLLSGNLALQKSSYIKISVIVLLAWLVFETVVSYPYYLSYFNQLYGGKNNGYKVASDSNLDWGRDLKDISRYVKKNNLSPLFVEYGWDGVSSLNYYNINGLDIKKLNKSSTGYLVIGGSAIYTDQYLWLDSSRIYDKITPSVFVYKLEGRNE